MNPAVLDSLAAAIVVLDQEGRILETNQAWCDLVRASGRDLPEDGGVGRAYLPVLAALGRLEGTMCADLEALLEEVVAEDRGSELGPRTLHLWLDLPDQRRWYRLRVKRFTEGASPHVVVGHHDNSAEHAARELAAREQAHLEMVLDQAPALLWALDADLRFTLVKGTGLAQLGLSGEDLVGRSLAEHLCCGPAAPPVVAARAALEGEVVEFEHSFQGKDWEGVMRPLSSQTGGVEGVLGFERDVTERRTMQRQLAISDRLANIGMLSASVAHEINNPLTFVRFHLEGLIEELSLETHAEEGSRQELARRRLIQAQEALEGLDRVGEIVRQLRRFANVEDRVLEPVELQAVISMAARMASNELRFCARLELDIAPGLRVEASLGRLCQVFLNLLVNSAQAFETDDLERNRVRLVARREGDRALISVTDNASGIAPEVLPRIFDSLFTTKPAGVGTGMGLSICRGIVEEFGGQISVESHLGEGSCFQVRFPACDRTPIQVDSHPEPWPSEDHEGRHGRILVVDDEVAIARMVATILGARHEVQVAHSGEAARSLLEGGAPFDAIFSDLMMEGGNGMELHAWVKRHQPDLAGRMVFMTGGAFTESAAAFLRDEAVRVVEKPFAPGMLRSLAAELVRRAP